MKKLALALAIVALALTATPSAQVDKHLDVTAFSSAARTASANSSSLYSKQFKGVYLTLNVSAASGTNQTLDVKLQSFDSLSAQWVDMSGAVFQRITATGQRTLTVYPSPEGAGNIRNVTGTDPAAGAEASDTVPANSRWKVLVAQYLLVTDANVATRVPTFIIDDGTTITAAYGAGVSPTASTTNRLNFLAGAGSMGSAAAGNVGFLPVGMTLSGGYRMRTATTLIQVGDNYAAPQFLVEEYIGNYAATPLPRIWRAVATIAGTTPSFTFTLAGAYLP